jgi:two-component system, NarL family, response regulator LiaR
MLPIGLKHTLCSYPQLEIVGIAEDGYVGVESAIACRDQQLKLAQVAK